MINLFSGNRRSAPLGPPKVKSDGNDSHDVSKQETLQAVRQRQRERQRRYVMQMMRAEKERDVAQESGESEKVESAEAQRRQMSDAADAIAQQIMIIERIMEEFGLTLDLEEEARADRELLEESREAYEQHVADTEDAVDNANAVGEFIHNTSSSYMMSGDAYDEDEAMRDLDECAKQTGRV